MPPPVPGSFRIFRLLGIDVYLHWLWFLLLAADMTARGRYRGQWSPYLWNVAEFLALFGIVLMHEFGHALACRSVGGRAQQIVLWPLGGIAFVQPPRRPAAVLWSIAAGPLVNLILMPPLIAAVLLSDIEPLNRTNLSTFLLTLLAINTILLVFNLLPIYPLDGGQILQATLWFFIGEARALRAAALSGLIAAMILLSWSIWQARLWLILIALFIGLQAWRGYRMARLLLTLEQHERVELDPWALRRRLHQPPFR